MAIRVEEKGNTSFADRVKVAFGQKQEEEILEQENIKKQKLELERSVLQKVAPMIDIARKFDVEGLLTQAETLGRVEWYGAVIPHFSPYTHRQQRTELGKLKGYDDIDLRQSLSDEGIRNWLQVDTANFKLVYEVMWGILPNRVVCMYDYDSIQLVFSSNSAVVISGGRKSTRCFTKESFEKALIFGFTHPEKSFGQY